MSVTCDLPSPSVHQPAVIAITHNRKDPGARVPATISIKASIAASAYIRSLTKRNCRFWTEDDDKLLRSMAAAGKSITLMTVKLGRPIRVIKSRAQELHIALPGEDKNTKRWVG
jgi:hypothetical protein